MRNRPIDLEQVRAFARESGATEYFTVAQQKSFAIYETREGIGITLDHSYYPISRANLLRYITAFNAWRKADFMRPSDFPRDLRQNSYMARILPQIRDVYVAEDEVSDIQSILTEKPTVARALVLARLGQGQFRDALLERDARCYVTAIRDARLLRAAHIKPWHQCDNRERLDPANGLLLSPTFDHLFDRALISFENDGRLLVSPTLERETLESLGVDTRARGRPIDGRTAEYMEHHRRRFRKQCRSGSSQETR